MLNLNLNLFEVKLKCGTYGTEYFACEDLGALDGILKGKGLEYSTITNLGKVYIYSEELTTPFVLKREVKTTVDGIEQDR